MLWLKAFHIIAVVCWFSGLFYLPRLFVYHAMSDDKVSQERFKVMERKLYRGIMTPSAVIAMALGIALITLNPGYYLQSGWMLAKLAGVFLLLIYHMKCWDYLKAFRDDNNTHGHVFYRWFNELPVILLFAIIILVVVKPF
ncbi:MAG: protoporphyrinogen oxidase HemJ [Pseudomonadales bacterium]|nr:protoporphyrinogen oxidase HemJ [Pseudomonadales bacterium]